MRDGWDMEIIRAMASGFYLVESIEQGWRRILVAASAEKMCDEIRNA